MKLSIIIPALNEEKNIKSCIESAGQLNPLEIIVSDGGSKDRTKEIAQSAGVVVIESPMGRGAQMNAGASFAKGDILLFLHADTVFEQNVSLTSLEKNYVGGFFRLKFDDNSVSTRLVELFANLRARLFSLPYGDQAIFLRRTFFEKMGGFKEYPFLEDLDLILRIRKYGKLRYIPVNIIASSRRIKKQYPFSPILISLRNVLIAWLFMLGASPYRLSKFYR